MTRIRPSDYIPPEPLDRLASALEQAEADWTSTHPQDSDGRFVVDAALAWTDILFGAATSLLTRDELEWLRKHPVTQTPQRISDAVTSPYMSPLAELLQVRLARDGLIRLKGGIPRLNSLLDLLLDLSPNEFTRAYLTRVALLYLWGFDDAVIVYARSVLDAALRAHMSDEQVAAHVNLRRSGQPQLDERINALGVANALAPDAVEAAHNIRKAGNEVLHDAPIYTHVQSPLDALRKLGLVLNALPRGSAE